jgi:hypothetical protein
MCASEPEHLHGEISWWSGSSSERQILHDAFCEVADTGRETYFFTSY